MTAERFKSGLTKRATFFVTLGIIIFAPISMYLWLLTGGTFGGIAALFTTLLFTELIRYSFQPLQKQEILMVYYGLSAIGALSAVPYFWIIYRSYFIHSPFSWAASINGKPLALLIPEWLTPPFGSSAYMQRSLLHWDFIPSIMVYTIRFALALIAELALGMLMARIYVEIERYEFPFARVDLALVTFISEKQPETTKITLLSMIPGIVWGLLTYVGPIILNIQFIPFPFYDLTWVTKDFLPGAALGISTLLSSYIGGFMVPFSGAVYILIVSLTIWIFLNSLFTTSFSHLFPEWKEEFFKGMGLISIQNRSLVRIWFAPQIGFGLAAAIFMIYKSQRGILGALKGLFSKTRESESILGFPSTKTLLIMFLGSTFSSVILHHYLLPDIPFLVPFFASVIYSFMISLVLTAAQGEIGFAVAPSYVWQSLVYLTPYQGYAGFVFEPVMAGGASPGLAQQIKVALQAETKPMDLIKLMVISSILMAVMGFISLNIFWSIAPIPSSAYPVTVINFPQYAQIDVFTATRQLKFTPYHIFIPMGGMLIFAFVCDALSKIGLPFSPLGLFMGPYYTPVGSIPLFIGAAISRFLMPRIFGGKDNWVRVRGFVVAGEMLGEGMLILLLTSVMFMSKAAWVWPW
ncbi:MAG: hypothetical protein QXL85_06000 [Candidatus Bathyarchaeia archaeon]